MENIEYIWKMNRRNYKKVSLKFWVKCLFFYWRRQIWEFTEEDLLEYKFGMIFN